MGVQDFRKLQVWRKAHSLVLSVYAKTANFPKEEMYALTSQIRRAAISIAANIAEGSSTGSDREFAKFLRISAASASEVEYFSVLALDLGLLDTPTAEQLIQDASDVRRMIRGLIASFSTSSPPSDPRRPGAGGSDLAAESS